MMDITSHTALELSTHLIGQYGPFVRLTDVWGMLGYPSLDAARKAAARGTTPMQTVFLPGRRGRFVRTGDLAKWLLRGSAPDDVGTSDERTSKQE